MGPWCDDSIDDCSKRNRWGSHNLTTSRYLAWYKAVSDAVTGVDSQLSVGGPASSVHATDKRNSVFGQSCHIARFHLVSMPVSVTLTPTVCAQDCWGNGVAGARCYGGHPRPTASQLLADPGENWALGLVEWGAKEDVRVDFSSTHSCETPCDDLVQLSATHSAPVLPCLDKSAVPS